MNQPTIGQKRFWKPGQRVRQAIGDFPATLIGQWAQYAWVVFDGRANPDTVLLHDLLEGEQPNPTKPGADHV